VAVVLTGCATAQIPIDDAYHWEDEPVIATPSVVTSEPEQEPVTPASPIIEILNEQDTTITVRIRK
jgi:hypothetical protein